ncbi:hypothetical protein J6590_034394 [Homalodisca vitripennis]|nr:hypothetical protein J6590_034394 [Homalodisca vitripennis]
MILHRERCEIDSGIAVIIGSLLRNTTVADNQEITRPDKEATSRVSKTIETALWPSGGGTCSMALPAGSAVRVLWSIIESYTRTVLVRIADKLQALADH